MARLIVDFEHGDAAAKRALLTAHADDAVVMDLSCLDPISWYAEFPQLKGSFPGQFAMSGKVELHLREELAGVEEAFRDRGLQPVRVGEARLGFTLPRTLAMIVNEAYFALAENVATKADIDRAMVYGVNYPAGPFQWAQGRQGAFVELLDALAATHGGRRYEVCPRLREEAR
jgi:hypothetical protein